MLTEASTPLEELSVVDVRRRCVILAGVAVTVLGGTREVSARLIGLLCHRSVLRRRKADQIIADIDLVLVPEVLPVRQCYLSRGAHEVVGRATVVQRCLVVNTGIGRCRILDGIRRRRRRCVALCRVVRCRSSRFGSRDFGTADADQFFMSHLGVISANRVDHLLTTDVLLGNSGLRRSLLVGSLRFGSLLVGVLGCCLFVVSDRRQADGLELRFGELAQVRCLLDASDGVVDDQSFETGRLERNLEGVALFDPLVEVRHGVVERNADVVVRADQDAFAPDRYFSDDCSVGLSVEVGDLLVVVEDDEVLVTEVNVLVALERSVDDIGDRSVRTEHDAVLERVEGLGRGLATEVVDEQSAGQQGHNDDTGQEADNRRDSATGETLAGFRVKRWHE
ncbi:MAG: hypothetical protein JWM52_681 [Candidatus Saccharibacteria bacterium]|nr:hypothetical protein [Candidatus Saccharibacteria bacterium]